MLLQNETALVTGASRGIGKSIALQLAKEGAHVVINYQSSDEKALAVKQEIESFGGKATLCKFDVSDQNAIKTALDSLMKEVPSISILVNNAGISKDGLLMRYSVEDWNSVMDTNLRSAFLITQNLIRPMMKARKGSIIHISSVVGIIGNPGQIAYCAAKAGLIGLTKSMAKELASRNIRVNAVAPGFIDTDMTHTLTEEQKKAIAGQIPLERTGRAEEIAHAVVYLASDRSSYVTGQVLSVDGGMSM